MEIWEETEAMECGTSAWERQFNGVKMEKDSIKIEIDCLGIARTLVGNEGWQPADNDMHMHALTIKRENAGRCTLANKCMHKYKSIIEMKNVNM